MQEMECKMFERKKLNKNILQYNEELKSKSRVQDPVADDQLLQGNLLTNKNKIESMGESSEKRKGKE
jgi:hypothetical protein